VAEPAPPVDGVAEVVTAIADQVRRRYVLPEAGEAAAAFVEGRLGSDRYDGEPGPALCRAVTEDLRTVAPDRHLRVVWHDLPRQRRAGDGFDDPQHSARHWTRARLHNHGLASLARLAGNVGLLDLRSIEAAGQTATTIDAAMTLVQYTDALLIDLRHNLGGDPDGVAYLCGYFLGPAPVHVNSVFDRASGTTRQYWTPAHLPAPRYLDRPVYVLTGPDTFSGAEEIAYNLQQLGRATLVGTVTRGGAHPTGDFWVAPQVSVRIPTARSVSPVTGTNWEGVGVRPDVEVPADEAFRYAYRLALHAVLDRYREDPDPVRRDLCAEATGALAEVASAGPADQARPASSA
jgi:peptidase S41-like protein